MTKVNTRVYVVLLGVAVLGVAATNAYPQADDALSKAPAWQPPRVPDVKAGAFAWLKQHQTDEATLAKATELWSNVPEKPTGAELLSRLTETFALADQNAAALVRLCSRPNDQLVLPKQPWLTDEKTQSQVANNMRLLYGRWLVHQLLFDEARGQLAGLRAPDVVAPAVLLFYQAVAHHTLLDKEQGLESLKQLIDGAEHSPRRYVALAQLMQQDLEGLDEDSLDHIARRMDDIRRRLDLGRGGKKVRKVEDGVIESLDKLIKKLEEQQKQCQGSSGGIQDNIRSTRPAPDSLPIGGKGPGQVTKRGVGSESGWGDLPPKDREEALQQIGREFPSHYRDVIEQYFRRLAAEGS